MTSNLTSTYWGLTSPFYRICVGMHYANQALFIILATMLWAADIGTSNDEDKKLAMLAASNIVDHGISAYVQASRRSPAAADLHCSGPAPFTASITPRFPEARTVLEMTLGRFR